ncbi:MAG: tetratricopeptide repeat protein, partial [Gemmatimonadota bacterium]
ADRWTRFETIGIPLNLVLAAVFLLVAFGGKDLGAATESVTMEDETGELVERIIPKSEFRKSLTTYYFDNISGDTALDWLQYGVPWTLEFDLQQDLFIDVRDSGITLQRLKEEGFQDGLDVPPGLKREIADNLHLGYFVAGSVSEEAGRLVLTSSLYETRRGRLVKERTFTGDDLLELVDEMTTQLKHDLETPAQYIEEAKDLPVSELLTSSLPAYRSFVDGVYARLVEADWETSLGHLQGAVREDPQFAMAHVLLWSVYFYLNDTENGQEALEDAMRLLYSLPERVQFEVKTIYYWVIRQDIEKALVAAGMYAELFPHDIQAHLMLAQFYGIKRERERAISALQRVLELDPGRVDALLGIGDLLESQGEFEAARDYYQQYAKKAPTDPWSFLKLGNLDRLLGAHEAAKQQYEKALVIDPDNVVALTRLADVDRDLGRFPRALEGYDEALAASVTPEQRAQVYGALGSYYRLRGQPATAVDRMHLRWTELEKYQGPFNLLQLKLQDLDTYVIAGRTEAARDTLASIAGQLSPPFDVLLSLGQMVIYLELEDADSMEMAIAGLERFIEAFGIENVRSLIVYAQGRVLEIRGDCEQAIVSYRRTLELEPKETRPNRDIGRCSRKLGRLDEAEAHLKRVLDIRPFNPLAHYEIALVYSDMGDRDKAVEHLRAALAVWSDADPAYKPARQARDRLAELEPNPTSSR